MQLSQYSRAQRSIVAQAVQAILNIFIPYRGSQITQTSWRFIVRGIFPIVDSARRESAVLMRQYYDSQRLEHLGDNDYDIDLPSYELDWLEESLRPVFNEARVIEFDDAKVVETSLRIAKEIENGGRRTALNAVRGETRRVGFARVATGRETCAFCLMLVSRGPVYKTELKAGAKHEGAAEILETKNTVSDDELDDLMTRWHPGCDCKVVPVFDEDNWQGRDDFLRMEDIWKRETRGFYGSQFTKNDKLNAFRRAIERGEINPAEFAAAA
jgi:hypothetical protein